MMTPDSSERQRLANSKEGSHIVFVLELAESLHRFGTPAHRLEESLERVAGQMGIIGQFFSTPTSLIAAFGEPPNQHTCLLRIQPGDVELERLVQVDTIADEVASGRRSPEEGAVLLREVEVQPPRYGEALTIASFSVASACAARFFGGGVPEIVSAAFVGLAIGVLARVSLRFRRSARLFEFLAGFFAAALALGASRIFEDLSTLTVTLGGLIVILPGLTLTLAINELATRNLVSGTARFMGAAMILMSIGFGMAIGRQVPLGPAVSGEAGPLLSPAPWTAFVAIIVTSGAFVVLFRAHPRQFFPIVASTLIAFLSARSGSILFGPELGACFGAFMTGVAGNLYSRIWLRPSAVPILPGIMVLVPGSIGFRSIEALFSHDVVSGIETAFSMIAVGVAIVVGLLLASAALPSKRSL